MKFANGDPRMCNEIVWGKIADTSQTDRGTHMGVGQNEKLLPGRQTDRQSGRRRPRGTQNVGVARLQQTKRHVGPAGKGILWQ